MNLPKDPIMMLGVVNTQLRDRFFNLEDLAEAYETTAEDIRSRLATVGYEYKEEINQFR